MATHDGEKSMLLTLVFFTRMFQWLDLEIEFLVEISIVRLIADGEFRRFARMS